MTRALVLSGGPGHDCPTTSALLVDAIAPAGVRAEVTEDLDAGLARLDGFDLLVVNALRWRMLVERYAPLRARWQYHLPGEGRRAVRAHVDAGKPVLAIHTAAICFDDWPAWAAIVGAGWDWERSCHPPIGEARVAVRRDAHPIVAGLDDFALVDEIYGFMDVAADVHPLATSPHAGAEHPLLWARTLPSGARVVFDALGHDQRSYDHPVHRTVLLRAARWVLGAPDGQVAAA